MPVRERIFGRRANISATREERTIVYKVFPYSTADDALLDPDCPKINDEHPNYPQLVAKQITAEPTGALQVIDVIVVYGYPAGVSSPSPGVKIRWHLGTMTQRIEVDLDGKLIGSRTFREAKISDSEGNIITLLNSLIDENAIIGTEAFIPTAELDIEMPKPSVWDPGFVFQYLTMTNSAPFFGIPAGHAQFMGPTQAEHIGPGEFDYHIIYHFRAGRMVIPEEYGGGFASLKEVLWYEYDLDETGARIPAVLQKGRVQDTANLNLLIFNGP